MNIQLSFYKQTDLEKWINKQYQENGIHYPSDLLDIDHIADIFKVEVYTYSGRCVADWEDDEQGYANAIILLHAYLSEEQKRERFFHELCHPIKHVGCQDSLPEMMKELQEIQAAHFQLYAAMPIYMLEEFCWIANRQTYLKVLSQEFKLSIPFVQKRIDQIERRINQEIGHQNFIASITQVAGRYEYSDETLRILDRAKILQAIKRGVI